MSLNSAVCRICLSTDVRMWEIANTPLQLVFETLTSNPLHTTDRRPVSVCYICYAHLKRCRKLMLTAAKADIVLTDILQRHPEGFINLAALIGERADSLSSLRSVSVECADNSSYFAPIAVKRELESPERRNADDNSMFCVPIEVKTEPEYLEVVVKCEINESDDGATCTESQPEIRNEGNSSNEKHETPKESKQPAERLQKCPICHKYFTKVSRHLKTHTGEKPYVCDICQNRFREKSHLQTHLRKHTGEKPYKCNICQSQLSEKSSLRRHILLMHSQKTLKCGVCDTKLRTKNELQRHLREHEKPYVCNICTRQFIKLNLFQSHLKMHNGEKLFECNICKSEFSKKSNYQAHLRTHTGEKPHECEICQSRFCEKSQLRAHLRTHTGEKPYECNVCQCKFTQLVHLQRHLKHHVGEKSNSD